MSDMADYYFECIELFEPNKKILGIESVGFEHTQNKVLWETRDGNTIAIEDMTTSHIINSITKCKRDRWRLEAIQYLEAELNKRKGSN